MSAVRADRSSTLLLALVAFGPLACLDVSPVHLDHAPDAASDVSIVTDALDDGDTAPLDTRTPCQDCIEYTGCADKIAACTAYPVCQGTYVCALAKGCFRFADFKAIVDCGIDCASAAGLRDQTSPEATAIIQVVACVQERCADVCVAK